MAVTNAQAIAVLIAFEEKLGGRGMAGTIPAQVAAMREALEEYEAAKQPEPTP